MTTVSTRIRLIILLAVAAAPAFGLLIYGNLMQRNAAEASARQDILNMAHAAALEQVHVIELAKQLLSRLSQQPSAILRDPKLCGRFAKQLLDESTAPYAFIGIRSLNGETTCEAKPMASAIQASLEKRFGIKEYQVSAPMRGFGMTLSFPIGDANLPAKEAAFVVLNVDEFERAALKLAIPAGWILTVTDSNGVIVARNPSSDELIGRKLSPAQPSAKSTPGDQGIVLDFGVDGAPHIFGYKNVLLSNSDTPLLKVLLAVPLSVVRQEANQALISGLAVALLLALLFLTAVWFGAERYFLSKVRKLLAMATRVDSGDLTARTNIKYTGDELSQVAKALDEMTATLQERQRRVELTIQHLHAQAITDPLTTLYNRRYLYELLPREILRTKRSGKTMALLMLDLDHFKHVNDTVGHEAGDLVLREAGALLKKGLRGSDIVCRYGGEEFCVALPDSSLEMAKSKAEALRQALENAVVNYCGNPIRISASIGVAIYPQHGGNADSLVRAADEALYQAKAVGRNCVVVSSTPTSGAPFRSVPDSEDHRSEKVSHFAENNIGADTRTHIRVPAATSRPITIAKRPAALQILSGASTGKELELINRTTTIGKRDDEVAVITQTSQGYFVTHIQGSRFPVVNGSTIEAQARLLKDRDVIEVANVKMVFFYR